MSLRLLPRRPDLRLIVTSATIETQRFAEFFGGAPVIDVEGRTYPVEVRYRPLAEEDEEAPPLPEAVRDALVFRHGIDTASLDTECLGETRLLVPTPDGRAEPRNRRVQVVTLGP